MLALKNLKNGGLSSTDDKYFYQCKKQVIWAEGAITQCLAFVLTMSEMINMVKVHDRVRQEISGDIETLIPCNLETCTSNSASTQQSDD